MLIWEKLKLLIYTNDVIYHLISKIKNKQKIINQLRSLREDNIIH